MSKVRGQGSGIKPFRVEKRNKDARVLAVRQSSKFHRLCKQKTLETLYVFPILQISSNKLTSLMESWCIVFLGNQFSWDKINPLTPGAFLPKMHFLDILEILSLDMSQTSSDLLKKAFAISL